MCLHCLMGQIARHVAVALHACLGIYAYLFVGWFMVGGDWPPGVPRWIWGLTFTFFFCSSLGLDTSRRLYEAQRR